MSNLLWTGEHWILYLRRPGEEANSGAVSLYRTAFSPAGEGTVALLSTDGPAGIGPAVYTDNPGLADFICETVIKWSASPFPQGLPLVEARFARGGWGTVLARMADRGRRRRRHCSVDRRLAPRGHGPSPPG